MTEEKDTPGLYKHPDGRSTCIIKRKNTLRYGKMVRRLVAQYREAEKDDDPGVIAQAQLPVWIEKMTGPAFKGLRLPVKNRKLNVESGLAMMYAFDDWDESILAGMQTVAILAARPEEGEQEPGFPGDAGGAESLDEAEYAGGDGEAPAA